MNQLKKHRHNSLFLCQAGLIAAIYTVLTVFVGALGLANGAIQFRISEALCVLPFFTAAAIPGLTVGCLISNLLMSCIWQDVVFGTLATLIGAIGTYALRKYKWLAPLPPILANTLIIPFVLAYAYGFEGGVLYFMLTVGIGEIISIYLLGLILHRALVKHQNVLF